jgi:dTDP-4-amino-4,6-dideoxygalactose transaminase
LPAWHLYAVQIDFPSFGLTRASFMRALAEEQIGSQVHYFPVHRQRYYAERYGAPNLPGADRYYARALSLPFFAAMNEDDVERVVHAIAKILHL